MCSVLCVYIYGSRAARLIRPFRKKFGHHKKMGAEVEKSTIIGIDLGTTNSCVSVIKDRYPKIIRNRTGKRTTPSTVTFGDKIVVGSELVDGDPGATVFGTKRLIGRKFEDPEIQKYIQKLPYKTVSHVNGDAWIKVSDRMFSPSQIAAYILTELKRCAEDFLKSPVSKSVITVPAYFNDSQRQATKDAGRLAGLKVLRVINEPTAAALAYGLGRTENGTIAVFDLGGGTFDISILEIKDGIFEVKSTNGNTHLGGEDIDAEIVDYVIEKAGLRHKAGNMSAGTLKRIRRAAEAAKIELSQADSTRIKALVELRDSPVDTEFGKQDAADKYSVEVDVVLTRNELEDIAEKIVNKTIEPCKKAIKDAKVDLKDIQHVILVGGMTRMPLVQRVVEKIFKRKPIFGVDPEEAVAKGAAVQGGILSGDVNNMLLLDVASLSLGIETVGGIFSPIIRRNTTLPVKETQVFTTSEDNQTEVDINIYQGERPLVKYNKFLGSLKLKNIPRAPKNVPKIEVTFESDANGICKITARDALTKKEQSLELLPSGGLTKSEIERMIKDAETKKICDQKTVYVVESKNKLRKFIEECDAIHADVKGVDELRRMVYSDQFDPEVAERKMEEVRARL
eukprot:jgi/Antlo1/2368/201